MRNLKRALSLALASVMLMGMMVVGSSAKDFTDADKIDNKEAVAITTGLGIFDGRDDGSFGAKDVVTRAEAAVVIAKILHGADVDPSNFVGTTKFTDVPAWAEGWVNLAASLNIIVGYGDGKFGPNDPVTTVQFTTMLLKALGYYTFDGALDADWALTVTSKATALGMYGDLVLPMNEGLTRENVAQLTWNALWEQRVAYEDYRGIYVKASNRNVVVTNGTEDDTNTLADDVFGLKKHENLMVANNGGVSVDLAEAGKTELVCADTDACEIQYCDHEYTYEFETGLDMIGHEATVYYTIEGKKVVVYAIVDEASKAVETTFDKNLTDMAKANGFDRDTKATEIYTLSGVEMDELDVKNGTPVILVSNNADLKIDYVIVLEQYLEYVEKVEVNDTDEDDITTDYVLTSTTLSDDDDAIVIGEVVKGDYVIVTAAKDDCFIVEAAETELVYIDEIDRDKKDHVTLYADETAYIGETTVEVALAADEDFTLFADVKTAGEYILVFDQQGRVIGLTNVEDEETEANVAYVAKFGWKINTEPSLKDAYRMTAAVYFADGTSGVYYVDMDEKFDGLKVDEFGTLYNAKYADDATYYINIDTELFAGLYDVDLEEKIVTIADLDGAIEADNINQIKNKVTKIGEMTVEVEGENVTKNLYANSKTQFWFVDGEYEDDLDDVTVTVKTGIKNVPTVFKAGEAHADITVSDVYNVNKDSKNIVDALVIEGFEEETSEDGIFLFNGNYTIKKHADSKKHDVIYKLYDAATGEKATLTYTYADYDKAYAAANDAVDMMAGEALFVEDGGSKANKLVTSDELKYVENVVFVEYEEEGDEITVYTVDHITYDAKIMDEKTIFVDLTGYGMEDLKDVEAAIKAVEKTWKKAADKYTWADESPITVPTVEVELSYAYDKNDKLSIIFVTNITEEFDLDLHDVIKK